MTLLEKFVNNKILFIIIKITISFIADLPEWSKGGDLRSSIREYACVQTAQSASFVKIFLYIFNLLNNK